MGRGISGGFSGGSPPIWPGNKGKLGQPLLPTDQVDSTGGAHGSVSGADVKAPAGTEQISKTTPGQKGAEAAQVKQTIVQSLQPKHITQQLAKLNIPVTDMNKELAFLMATHGIEISEDSFNLINKLLKGKKSKSAKESAIFLLSKGLGDKVDDLNILNNLLSKNSKISKSIHELSQLQSKMFQMLSNALKDNPSLQSFLSMFDDYNDQLKQLKKISKGNQLLVNQHGFLEDSLAMASFMKGLAAKMNLSNKALMKYINELGKLNQNVIAQIILSQDSIKQPLGLLESFHYFQLPNPLSAQAVVEMLLRKHVGAKKSKSKKKNTEGDEQEKVIISMDTETMGKLTIIVVVMGFKVWCTIYSDKDSAVNHVSSFRNELSENLQKYQYKLEDFKTARKKINLQKFIAPSQDISEVKRVETEI